MSTEYVAVIVSVLSFILAHFKINIGSDEITSIVTSLATAGSAIWLLVKRYKRGGVNVAGIRI